MKIMYKNKNLKENYSKKAKIRAKDFEVKKIIKEWEKVVND